MTRIASITLSLFLLGIVAPAGAQSVPGAVEGLGADKILFATDYPHFDSGAGPINEFLEAAPLDETARRRILWSNTAEFYGLSVD